MTEKLICGIDIGTSKIATVVAVKSSENRELQIIGFNTNPSRGIKKGLIVDIDEATEAVEESVERAERMSGHKINSAYVSVGGPSISSTNSHGIVAVSNPTGEIGEDDVFRVIEAARAISLSSAQQIIEVIPRDFIVDGQSGIKNPVGMSGVRLEVETHIITASSINLKNIDRVLSDLGIKNKGYVFSGLSSSLSVLTPTEKELGVVVVDIGGGKTDICIYVDGSLSYSSSIPIGARHITNDIAVGLRVSLDSAEKIKLFLSKNVKKKSPKLDLSQINLPENIPEVSTKTLIDEIISARLEEVFKLIFAEIEKSGFLTNIPAGLVITGGGSLTVSLLEIGKKVIGLPIRIGLPRGITGLIDEIIDPQYATTVGLILYGEIFKMEEEISFKNFNRLLKDFSLTTSIKKIKDFIKQFIP